MGTCCCFSFSILFYSLFLFSDYLLFGKEYVTTGEVEQGRTGPSDRNARRNRGVNRYVSCYIICSLLYVFLLLALFPLSTAQQQVGLGRTQWDRRGWRSNRGCDRGTGEREEEVEG